MPISIDEVRRIARLAKLDFAPQELERLSAQLDSILTHVDRLREVPATGLEGEPAVGATESALRADEPRPSLGADAALANAPDPGDGHFRVPRVIG